MALSESPFGYFPAAAALVAASHIRPYLSFSLVFLLVSTGDYPRRTSVRVERRAKRSKWSCESKMAVR
jgi:hypothetical protein